MLNMAKLFQLAFVFIVAANFAFAHHIPGHLVDDTEGLVHKEAVQEGPGVLWTVSEGEQKPASVENVKASPESPVILVQEEQEREAPTAEGQATVTDLQPEEKSAVLAVQLPPNPVAETVVVRIPEKQEQNVSPEMLKSKENPNREEAAGVKDKTDSIEDSGLVGGKEKVEKEKCFFSFFGSKEETTTTSTTTEAPPKGESVRTPQPDISQSPGEYGTTKWTIPSRVNFPVTKARRRLALPRTQLTTPLIGFPYGSPTFQSQSPILQQAAAVPHQQAFVLQPGLPYAGPLLTQQAPIISQSSLLQPLLARPVGFAPLGLQSGVYVLTPKDKAVIKPTKKETEEPAEEEKKEEKKKEEEEEEEAKPEDVEEKVEEEPKQEEDQSEVTKDEELKKEENLLEKEQRKGVRMTAGKESPARWFFGGWGGYYEPEYYYDYYDYEYHHHSPYSWYW